MAPFRILDADPNSWNRKAGDTYFIHGPNEDTVDMEQIVFLERDTFKIAFRRPDFAHEWVEFGVTKPEEVVDRLEQASIVIANKLPLRAAQLSQVPKLRMIAVAATGVDNIDLEYCRRKGIAVCNARNYAAYSLPEHVLMLMLALRRSLPGYRDDVRHGKWQSAEQFCLLGRPISDLHGSTLGIVGHGFLGQAVERLARAVGMEVLVSERKGANAVREGRVQFEEVLRRSDVITLHCPLNESTRNLIAEPEFRLLNPHALIINTARGGLVNEGDLLAALQEQRIAGAGIDVLTNEPPRDGNVLLKADLPNLIITPHIAWASRQAMETLADQLIDSLEAFVRGESKNRVI